MFVTVAGCKKSDQGNFDSMNREQQMKVMQGDPKVHAEMVAKFKGKGGPPQNAGGAPASPAAPGK